MTVNTHELADKVCFFGMLIGKTRTHHIQRRRTIDMYRDQRAQINRESSRANKPTHPIGRNTEFAINWLNLALQLMRDLKGLLIAVVGGVDDTNVYI